MNSIPNLKYFVSFEREILKRAIDDLTIQKTIRVARPLFEYMSEFCLLSSGFFCFLGLASLNINAVFLGGAAAAAGGIFWLFKVREVSVEKAIDYLQEACRCIDAKKYHEAIAEIEKAENFVPGLELSDCCIFLNQSLYHLHVNEKGPAIASAKKLVQKIEEEVEPYFKTLKYDKKKREGALKFLEQMKTIGSLISTDFDRVQKALGPSEERYCHFHKLYLALSERL